ncbi:hypothetical protein E4U60_001785 [Claviceps pazoutovae]|uniref:Mitochondrial outer membrane transport complex Sam37/metaxin N-terminal domain-containing protein n=1 Tax=Claviceps pazoutovae TaxID=1649127 RepID=A0A9P7MCH5_9HYPO|nr:hypothetical protein E4U60_001785 [Claviceps pazoutovae]
MLDLYIWGPAFGLPSIDPECLAILLYLDNALPSDSWRIIPCNDPSISPLNLLPAINHHGSWTSGYLPIIEYTKHHFNRRSEKHEDLSPAQQADAVAYCSFLTANAAPLVYLSLYVSAANWSTTTRPAYSALLPFPLTWTLPPLIRAEACQRAEHLGLAELDTDFDPNGGLHLTAGRDALPETFRRHLPARTKKTVREEMTPEQASAIRLYSLAEDCLSVLNALMVGQGDEGARPCFFGHHKRPSSADCLAYAYLALMTVPPVPRSFLKDYILAELPRLAIVGRWASGLSFELVPVPRPTIFECAARVTDSLFGRIPAFGKHYAKETLHRKEAGKSGVHPRTLIMAMGFLVATGAAFGYGLQLYKTLRPLGSSTQIWRQRKLQPGRGNKLSQFGDLGSMLDSAMGAYEPAPSLASGQNGPATGHLVEADSEVD